MREVRALIVDDEPVARAGLRKLLAGHPRIVVVGDAGDGPAAVRAIRKLRPDLLLLDVQMPEMNGFDVLDAVGADTVPAVVFVTAYDHFALRAFEMRALDYLLKPFDDERFASVIARALEHVDRQRDGDLARRLASLLEAYEARAAGGDHTRDMAAPAHDTTRAQPDATTHGSYLSRIIVRGGGRVFFQPVEEIDWIEAADYYARLHVGGKAHLVRETMAALESQLDPICFVRIHRSAIVNVERVVEIRLDWQNKHIVVMRNGERLPLSRRRREMLEQVMSRSAR
jgi:two-component system LytT family response regulator